MAFKGITFAGQNVTPKNDGALYGNFKQNGYIQGCEMTISGDNLVIQSGHMVIGGRVVEVDGATSIDLSGKTVTTGYIQVIICADTSQPEGTQWYTRWVESATTTFPALTQDDINGTGTLHEEGLAIVRVSGGNLTSLYATLRESGLITQGWVFSNTPTQSLGKHPRFVLQEDGSNVGEITKDGTNNRLEIINDVGNNGIRFADNGTDVIYSNGGNINFRTAGGDGTNQFQITPSTGVFSTAIYNTTSVNSANMYINSYGNLMRSTSLRKHKKSIHTISEEEAVKGYDLDPVAFHSNIEGDTSHELYGFIAEEVEKVLPNLATYDEDGKLIGVAYDRVCAILLKQNQMLKARVDALEKRVEKLEGK